MLKLKNITKNYYIGQTVIPALAGVSLDFNQNEFVAVLGPSGCGKTTLLNIIGGLDRYTSGDLIINGRSTKNYKQSDWDAYRNHSIGFVFQNYNLITHLSVLQNVELALTLSGISKKERQSRAAAVLGRVGLNDQLYKKPSQLSGGQMQRVAIARALINDPDILLTDEPTGALDSQTSAQIMELIKEISGERLVIMVTHNPEIASKYSTRIIRLLDGLVISDEINSAQNQTVLQEIEQKTEGLAKISPKKQKTSMNFFTALTLSFKNLFTKKVRSAITAAAGSIGIVGIALVLSLSNGFNGYIKKIQGDTMSNYPIIIEESSTDYSAFMGFSRQKDKLRPDKENVYAESLLKMFADSQVNNKLTKDYIDYVKDIDANLVRGTTFGYGIKYENYFFANTDSGLTSINTIISNLLARWEMISKAAQGGGLFKLQTLPDQSDFLSEQYELIYGEMPSDTYDLALIVDEYNKVSDISLLVLGLLPENYNLAAEQKTAVKFEDVLKKRYRIYSNDEVFERSGSRFIAAEPSAAEGEEVRISGVLRIKEGTAMGAFSSGIAASQKLTNELLQKNNNSEIVSFISAEATKDIDPLTGIEYAQSMPKTERLRSLGGNDLPNEVRIYPKDFKAKAAIKGLLDTFNQRFENEEDKIIYVDNVELMLSTMSTMVDAISYVLIAFTAISLIVSSVMIGIITYVSVIERTKEIGILRSLGARKKDISRVFNAETFIIGLSAGIIGIVFASIFNIPINFLLKSLVDGTGSLAVLNPLHGAALILVSIALTFIAGLIPSKIAANKDPVVALRTE